MQPKLPPHDIESEQAVLGGLLLDSSTWIDVADAVTEADFYHHDHRVIFAAISRLAEDSQPVDVVTVTSALKAEGIDIEYTTVGKLAMDVPSAANVRHYATLIRDKAILRSLARGGAAISELGYANDTRPAAERLDEAERMIAAISDSRDSGGLESIKTMLPGWLDSIDTKFHSESEITGQRTGLVDFDNMTAGLHPGELIVIAGRPSMGKSALAMNIVEQVVVRDKKAAAVFSLEMPREQLIDRLATSMGRVPMEHLRRPRLLDDSDWPKLSNTTAFLKDAQLFIDDGADLTITELRSRVRRAHRKTPLSLVVIDYLQLMTGSRENRNLEVTEISRGLKTLAKDIDVPVIALSQLNRSVEQRANKRPMMSDLRESGAIEQDADLIAFIYRDEVYNEDSPHKGVAEIIIGKQRNGPRGVVECAYLGEYCRFENYGGPNRYEREAEARPKRRVSKLPGYGNVGMDRAAGE